MHPLKCVLVKPPFALPNNKAYDVAGLGLNAVDHLCVVPHFPQFDSKLRMIDFSRQGGGQAATAMVTCQRLGLKTRYLGKVGDDAFGEYSLHSLEEEEVTIEGVVTVPGTRNQFAFPLPMKCAAVILPERGMFFTLRLLERSLRIGILCGVSIFQMQ